MQVLSGSGCSIVGHCLQKTADSLSIEIRDAPVLLDYLGFICRHSFGNGSLTGNHICGVATILLKGCNVLQIQRTAVRAKFIVLLSAPTDPQQESKISLRQLPALTLFPEPFTDPISNEHLFDHFCLT